MSSRISIILASLALLCSFGIHEALAQPPPLVPPRPVYGVAFVDNVILNAGHNVSIKMELFLVIFLDGSDDQTDISEISSELQGASASGGTVSLPNLQAAFAQSSSPATSLSNEISVADVEPLTTTWPLIGCWQVIDRDNHNAYTVQIIEPASKVLEVYQHNGLIVSTTTSNYSPVDDYNYSVDMPLYSDEVRGEGNYVIREAGKATTGDIGYAYVNGIRANKIYIDGEEVMVTPPYITIYENKDVMKVDIYAPSAHEFIMYLEEGWNWISFPIGRCFYQGTPPSNQPACVGLVNISSLGYTTMADWFTSIVEPEDAWQAVIGEFGSMNVDIDSSYHSLKYMSPVSGYRVRIKDGIDNARLSLSGSLFDAMNCDIHLSDGWNWIGFCLPEGYYDSSLPSIEVPVGTIWLKVNAPVAEYIFEQISPRYIIGEFGSYNADYPSYSSLHYLAPGRAYRIKLDQEADFRYR